MTREDRLLRILYPGREEFSDSEREFASMALSIAMEVSPRRESSDVPIWGRFMRSGVEYECIPRPATVSSQDGCSGCAFDKAKACNAPRCSKFDRFDGEFVWFRRVK